MWMHDFIKKLYDFKDIYVIFWSQNSYVDKNHCNLILIVKFDFDSNMTVG